MLIIPAIDLRGGRCVRLRQGDFGQETVYSADPLATAAHWESSGAERIHLVDLDGAKTGEPAHLEIVAKIAGSVRVPCQLGGGLRDEATIRGCFDAGIDRVVVGTQALRDREWFRELTKRYPSRVVLGLDARDGLVASEGWVEGSQVPAIDLARALDDLPLAALVFTDIARDGMLGGPNLAATRLLAESLRTPVIASGGVGSLEDLRQLARLPLAGCIVGRALYDGRFTLREAICAAEAPAVENNERQTNDRP